MVLDSDLFTCQHVMSSCSSGLPPVSWQSKVNWSVRMGVVQYRNVTVMLPCVFLCRVHNITNQYICENDVKNRCVNESITLSKLIMLSSRMCSHLLAYVYCPHLYITCAPVLLYHFFSRLCFRCANEKTENLLKPCRSAPQFLTFVPSHLHLKPRSLELDGNATPTVWYSMLYSTEFCIIL